MTQSSIGIALSSISLPCVKGGLGRDMTQPTLAFPREECSPELREERIEVRKHNGRMEMQGPLGGLGGMRYIWLSHNARQHGLSPIAIRLRGGARHCSQNLTKLILLRLAERGIR